MATVIKIVPRLAWDGGAILIESMREDGIFLWKIGAQAKGVACGLSIQANNGDYAGQSHTWFFSNGLAFVKEYGIDRIEPFPFSPATTFSILVRRGVVAFYHQAVGAPAATLAYTSSTAPRAFPLVLDCAMYAPGDSVYEADYLRLIDLEALPPGTPGIPDDPLLVGASIENQWRVTGFGGEWSTDSAWAYNQWIVAQPDAIQSEPGPDALANALQPFAAAMVDGSIAPTSGYGFNQLPTFVNSFSFGAVPDVVTIENQWWIDDLLSPGNDYAPTIANQLRPFLGFGSEVSGDFARNKIHPFVAFGLELAPQSVYFQLRLPTLRGFSKVLGENGEGGIAVFPTITAGGWGLGSLPASKGSAVFPTITAQGSSAGRGGALFPTLVASGTGGPVSEGWGLAEFPTLEAYGEGLGSGVGEGDALFPTLVAVGRGVGPFQGVAWFPALVASGKGKGGGTGRGRAWFPVLVASGKGKGGGTGRGRAVYPVFEASGRQGNNGRVLLPALIASGEGRIEGTTESAGWPRAYWVNLATGAITEAPELENIIALYAAHGRLYGLKSDHSLIAFDVVASLAHPVAFHVRTANDLLDEKNQRYLKRLDTVYLIGRFNGQLQVRIINDETEYWDYISHVDYSSGTGVHKVNVGRGTRFAEVAFEVSSIDNDYITLADIIPLVAPHSRRPK